MLKAKIVYDTDALDPRKEFDNVSTMICFHKRYGLEVFFLRYDKGLCRTRENAGVRNWDRWFFYR